MPLHIGINYPWIHYDWDFGEPPRGPGGHTFGPRAEWRTQLAEDLAEFAALGIEVVRWWVLGSGQLYGTGIEAPRRRGAAWTMRNVPQLAHAIGDDFRSALPYFRCANLKLIPVFVDYLMFLDPPSSTTANDEFVKGGRQELLSDATKRGEFLENALAPLLAACSGFHDVIYAWDLINEPEWCVRNPGRGVPRNRGARLSRASMLAFLREGIQRINCSGLHSTVGFFSYDTTRSWRSTRLGIDRHQFHHYPRDNPLPRHAFRAGQPTIIGEFASAPHRPWPDMTDAERSDPNNQVYNRLRHIAERGYPLALLWSAQASPTSPGGGETATVDWSEVTRAQIRRFTSGV